MIEIAFEEKIHGRQSSCCEGFFRNCRETGSGGMYNRVASLLKGKRLQGTGSEWNKKR